MVPYLRKILEFVARLISFYFHKYIRQLMQKIISQPLERRHRFYTMSKLKRIIPATVLTLLSVINSVSFRCFAENCSPPQYLIPCGTPFGIKVKSCGVMVIETEDHSPAENAGIKSGDVITAVNGMAVSTNSEIADAIQMDCNSTEIVLSRKTGKLTLSAKPEKVDGTYKLGMWVRDSAAGIGTLTFYNPADDSFGGLGHGVNDPTTGKAVPLGSGEITGAAIYDIVKGEEGTAGELCGAIYPADAIGSVSSNTEAGVFGKLFAPKEGQAIPVAKREEIHSGKATVLTTVDDTGVGEYDIEIVRMNFFDPDGSKGMLIRITDSRLLEKTGGIVKGMSGSPIIQDGKLAGAVTHVLIKDPTCGYAITAESMLKHCS